MASSYIAPLFACQALNYGLYEHKSCMLMARPIAVVLLRSITLSASGSERGALSELAGEAKQSIVLDTNTPKNRLEGSPKSKLKRLCALPLVKAVSIYNSPE
jgi:hypothetical protein